MTNDLTLDTNLDTPTALPVGLAAFHEWADDIIQLAGKFADEDSMKYALASQLIHLPHDKAHVPKRFFVNCLRKAAANQVASQVFMDIKLKQEAAAKQTAAEATPVLTQEPSDAAAQKTTA